MNTLSLQENHYIKTNFRDKKIIMTKLDIILETKKILVSKLDE